MSGTIDQDAQPGDRLALETRIDGSAIKARLLVHMLNNDSLFVDFRDAIAIRELAGGLLDDAEHVQGLSERLNRAALDLS